MTESIALSALAKEIFTGATNQIYSSDITSVTGPVAQLVTGPSLSKQGDLALDEMRPVTLLNEKNAQRFILGAGDVLLLARGTDMRAAYVSEDAAALTLLASANLLVVRPDAEKMHGAVLTTYLNSPEGRALLAHSSMGAALPNIPLAKAKSLPVPVVRLHKQAEIVEMFHARNRLYKATLELAERQFSAGTACMMQMIKEKPHEHVA